MNILGKIWNFIVADNSESESDLRVKAKLSDKEVSEVAWSYGKAKGWGLENMRPPNLTTEKSKLVWRVRFGCVDDEGLPMKGGHLLLMIDDNSGNIVKETIGRK